MLDFWAGREVVCSTDSPAACRHDFPDMLVSESMIASVSIVSRSFEEVEIARIAFPDSTGEYRADSVPSPFVVPAENAGTFAIAMTPAASGLRTARLEIDGVGQVSEEKVTLAIELTVDVAE